MSVISGFGALEELPWECITDKIERRVLAGQQGMIVWWKMKAGARALFALGRQRAFSALLGGFCGKITNKFSNE
jgi:hypothetical protein